MICRMARASILGLATAVVWLSAPGESHAIFHWFSGCCNQPRPYVYNYAGPFCNSGVQVNYTPTTCYRTTYVNVPVTQFCAAPAIDPCTGCQTTVMRPVVTMMPQARLVPYTTYRLSYSYAAASPAAAYYGSTANAGCAGCSTATSSYYAPSHAASTRVTPTYNANTRPAYESAPANYEPSAASGSVPSAGTRRTFAEGPAPAEEKTPEPAAAEEDQDSAAPVEHDSAYRGQREAEADDSQSDAPALVNPNNRTTRRAPGQVGKTGQVGRTGQVVRAGHRRALAAPAPAGEAPRGETIRRARHANPHIDTEGWRPSSR